MTTTEKKQTAIRLSGDLISQIDQLAFERGLSRNKLIEEIMTSEVNYSRESLLQILNESQELLQKFINDLNKDADDGVEIQQSTKLKMAEFRQFVKSNKLTNGTEAQLYQFIIFLLTNSL
ncbi:hypothetical protein [Persicobacter diffluens]|uniref:Uncharacterized protein n=1 Tax=Persicobacter diffluens TaxID=981 RepID=A0AAN5AQK1_9BACT|nr:hypothetical protein PEDI_54850 [Persicobacter diffluens]